MFTRRGFLGFSGKAIAGSAVVAFVPGCGLDVHEVRVRGRMTVADALSQTGRFQLQEWSGYRLDGGPISGVIVTAADGFSYPITPGYAQYIYIAVNGIPLASTHAGNTMLSGGEIVLAEPTFFDPRLVTATY